jgi:hypothetical protein
MKNITQRVIEFLSHAELPFGGEEDLLLLDDPAAFQARVTGLLDEGKLDAVAWSFVGLEFQARIETAARFFDGDAREAQ